MEWTTSLLILIHAFIPLARAGPGWVSLSLTGPNALAETANYKYYLDNVQVGTPPASESLAIHIQNTLLGVSSSDCTFCPGKNLFDPSLSSTLKYSKPWISNSTDIGGNVVNDTISFGGVLTSKETPFALFENMSPRFSTHFPDGVFGLWVDPNNATARQQHIFTRLHNAGELMNPVIGLRMGRTPATSRFTIGALDENDFDGTINWVEAEPFDPSWPLPLVIKFDGFVGFNGSSLPPPSPLLTYIDSFNPAVFFPGVDTFMSQEGYRGPGDPFDIDPRLGSYGLPCNNTLNLAVQINGVKYEIESQGNLVRELDPEFDECRVSLSNFSVTNPTPVRVALGAPFLRSVYIAYRFPTDDCPKAYYGFAFQKGANRTSSMIEQQPASTPSASAQCLSFTKPTATPSVTIAPPQVSADQFVSKEAYSVWGDPGGTQVKLIGVEYLEAGRVP